MEKYKGKYRVSSARLKNWNYGSPGFYFVTICTKNRKHYFGDIVKTENIVSVNPTNIGIIANEFWAEIPNHFPSVELDEYVIMPDHVHGVLSILDDVINVAIVVETLHATSLQHATSLPSQSQPPSQLKKNYLMSEISPKPGSLSTVLRSFKSAVTKWCNENNLEFGWQPRFHDHIIRSEDELNRIRNYIINNPKNWSKDKNNNENLLM